MQDTYRMICTASPCYCCHATTLTGSSQGGRPVTKWALLFAII